MRATLIILPGVGFTGGAAFERLLVATALIPAHTAGSSVFYFGGAVPLIAIARRSCSSRCPSRLQFAALRGKSPMEARAVAQPAWIHR